MSERSAITPAALQAGWAAGRILALPGPALRDRQALAAAIGEGGLAPWARRWGAGVVIGSGGSRGGRRWCLQPLAHLERSAAATGLWLTALGLDPAACVQLNPLPLHHVSGLLPLVRARCWGAPHVPLDPQLLRHPERLCALPPLRGQPALLSLVPTQLERLMQHPAGLAWLRQLALIWVGGAPLPPPLAAAARSAGLPLAPCYGATETAAMVCALPPGQFLAGARGCGLPLDDVELRVDPAAAAVEIRTARLSPGWLEGGQLQPLPGLAGGWWRSGDAGWLAPAGLELLGRLDGAIHSGGETVFPEQLEERLLAQARDAGLALAELLLLPVEDGAWGQRLVALVRPAGPGAEAPLEALAALTRTWAPAERPRRWLSCPPLARSSLGKWQRSRWRAWLDELEAGSSAAACRRDVDSL
jgi:O-succinylbenzoic acid--CoA ligase